jgi:enoyl-CoA hydratase/carnithine racemase
MMHTNSASGRKGKDMAESVFGDVVVQRGADYVATVEIRRAPHNFFDVQLIDDLVRACGLLAETDCRAVVLCSAGRNFCAGANFGAGGPGAFGDLYERACALFDQPLPIVAAVQGAAIGGGLGLALAADLRVATPESRFAANFARLGFHHGFGLTETLPLAVGHQRAIELMYTGRRIDGTTAHEIGLCEVLVSADGLREAARSLAASIAESAPLAVHSIRHTMRAPLVARIRAAVQRECAEQERLSGTDDWTEGLAASAERRMPHFVGR